MLKHYPHWDFRSYESHSDPYTHWNEFTPYYYGTSTYPMTEDPWERGSKVFNTLFPLFAMFYLVAYLWAKKMRRRDIMLSHPWVRYRIERWRYR